jgi:hypothetical protein
MYCRNCSNEVSPQAIACPKCGVPPMKGKHYCQNCGVATHEDAIICVKCGVGLINSNKTDGTKFIATFSKFSYINYIVIILLSLMPFVNFKCGDQKVYTVTGLDLGLSKERHYTETKHYQVGGDYDWPRTETIFSLDILLFYIAIIICLLCLITSAPKRFKYARNFTIVALIILAEWSIVTNGRINKSETNLLDISFGAGFWLTLVITILSGILLSIYLTQNKSVENIPVSSSIEESVVQPIAEIKPRAIEVVVQQEMESPYIQQEDITFEESRSSSKKKYIIIGLVALIIILGMLFLFQREKSDSNQTSQTDTLPQVEISDIKDDTSSAIDNNTIQKPEYITYTVSTDRAYFYTCPDETTKRKAYLVKNELLQGCCEQDQFVSIHFTNSDGKISEGWVNLRDLTSGDTRTTINNNEQSVLKHNSILDSLKIGMSLDKLVQLNSKPITFYGFEWDDGGTIISFNNGLLSDLKGKIILSYKNVLSSDQDAFYNKFVGDDKKIESTDPDIVNLKLKIFISSINIHK